MVVEQLLITSTVEICIQQLGRVEEMVRLPYDAIRKIYHALSLCVKRVCQWQRRLVNFWGPLYVYKVVWWSDRVLDSQLDGRDSILNRDFPQIFVHVVYTTCTKNLENIAWFRRYPRGQIDRHTQTCSSQYFATAPAGEVINNNRLFWRSCNLQ